MSNFRIWVPISTEFVRCQVSGVRKNEIEVFQNEQFGQLRAMLGHEGEPLMMGTDVAKRLGYKNPSNALQVHVDKEDKTSTLIQGSGSNYKSKAVLINESGLYSLILSSCTQRVHSGTDPVCTRVNLKVVVFIACCVPAFVIKGGALFFEPDTCNCSLSLLCKGESVFFLTS